MLGQKPYYIFTCSVSDDLYGACLQRDGTALPTPGGGNWLPVDRLADLGDAAAGFDVNAARQDIADWGCHWFTSKGPREIYWGPQGPPIKRVTS